MEYKVLNPEDAGSPASEVVVVSAELAQRFLLKQWISSCKSWPSTLSVKEQDASTRGIGHPRCQQGSETSRTEEVAIHTVSEGAPRKLSVVRPLPSQSEARGQCHKGGQAGSWLPSTREKGFDAREETSAGPSSESKPTHEDKMETSSSTPDTNVLQQLPTLSDVLSNDKKINIAPYIPPPKKSIMVLEGYPLGFPLDRLRDHPLRLRRLAYSSGEPIPVEQRTPRVFTRKLHTWNRPANPDTISSPKNNIATGTPPSIPLRPEHSRVIPQHNSMCSNCGNPNNSTHDVDFLATLLHMGLSLSVSPNTQDLPDITPSHSTTTPASETTHGRTQRKRFRRSSPTSDIHDGTEHSLQDTLHLQDDTPTTDRHQWTTPSINIFRLSAQYIIPPPIIGPLL
ncbi:hypothetical protein C7M84_019938 [Penaeus vannamei]|uniref:Uncharacterized protein n=1 Tax=Penaeus vannamei TaxID=6689 RepID=A0A3R7LR57_PENVA|nr:hypothetical protein C7M84_019938 [Penaeus vannamei]